MTNTTQQPLPSWLTINETPDGFQSTFTLQYGEGTWTSRLCGTREEALWSAQDSQHEDQRMAELDEQLGVLIEQYDSTMIIDALLKRARDGDDHFLKRGLKGLECTELLMFGQ